HRFEGLRPRHDGRTSCGNRRGIPTPLDSGPRHLHRGPALSDAVRVLIADDHPPTRAGVRAALERSGFIVCAEAADARAAIDPARLPLALRGVLDGEAALPRRLVALLIEEFRERKRRRRLPLVGRRSVELTDRESEVLEAMRQGLTTYEIAARLFISPVTVRTHVSAILRKLH